jgi:hypothetical protein
MPERKQAPSETLIIRLARVAGSVAGTLAAKTAKVVARTESAQKGGRKPSGSQPTRPKQGRAKGKKKLKRAGQKRKRNRTRAA